MQNKIRISKFIFISIIMIAMILSLCSFYAIVGNFKVIKGFGNYCSIISPNHILITNNAKAKDQKFSYTLKERENLAKIEEIKKITPIENHIQLSLNFNSSDLGAGQKIYNNDIDKFNFFGEQGGDFNFQFQKSKILLGRKIKNKDEVQISKSLASIIAVNGDIKNLIGKKLKNNTIVGIYKDKNKYKVNQEENYNQKGQKVGVINIMNLYNSYYTFDEKMTNNYIGYEDSLKNYNDQFDTNQKITAQKAYKKYGKKIINVIDLNIKKGTDIENLEQRIQKVTKTDLFFTHTAINKADFSPLIIAEIKLQVLYCLLIVIIIFLGKNKIKFKK